MLRNPVIQIHENSVCNWCGCWEIRVRIPITEASEFQVPLFETPRLWFWKSRSPRLFSVGVCLWQILSCNCILNSTIWSSTSRYSFQWLLCLFFFSKWRRCMWNNDLRKLWLFNCFYSISELFRGFISEIYLIGDSRETKFNCCNKRKNKNSTMFFRR